jgi:hypothetical protein
MKVNKVTNYLFIWMISVTGFIILINKGSKNPFFLIGPNEHLTIFYIKIDTYLKYLIVVFYTLMSTIIRTLQKEVISPWVIQSVQNHEEKSEYIRKYAYQVVIIDGMYNWFDWFMYMNILLTQIDMMLIEMIGNLVISYIITYHYLNRRTEPLPESNYHPI